MKKILLISTEESVFHAPVLRALAHLHLEVAFVDFRGSSVLQTSTVAHKLVRRLPKTLRNPIVNRANASIDKLVLTRASEFKPDLILALKAKNLNNATLESLRKIAPTVNWYPDSMNNWESIQRLVSHFDYFFEFDKYVVDLLKNAGHSNVYLLPFCGDIPKDAQWHETTNKYPISFIGSYNSESYPMRLEILDKIKDLGLHIWGNNAWAATHLRDYFHGPIEPNLDNLRNIYRQSKIVVHMDSNLLVGGGTGLTMRPFDATAAGALLVAQDDRPEIYNMFEPGKEFVLFHDSIDIREKVIYYLEHDEERLAIARAGFERTRRDHTYLDRIKSILETVEHAR
jgi:spore maturation protein CgeB